MTNQRRFPRIFFVLTVFGIVHLLTMLDRPTLATIRGVDFVRLIGTGMLFGAAIVILVQYVVDRRSS